jgi:UDP-N-acetylglucosamine:LPS N-acetylglucosamine transferase
MRIPQRELTVERLAELLHHYRRDQLLAMAIKARGLGRADAADRSPTSASRCRPRVSVG